MPDNVLNLVYVEGEEKRIWELLEQVKQDDIGIGSIDFNKIIPIPEELEAAAHCGWMNEHWGTKENAYGCRGTLPDSEEVRAILGFQTAGIRANKIVEKLAERYPDLAFTHWWASECLGAYVGDMSYENGKIVEFNIPGDFSKEALETAAILSRYCMGEHEEIKETEENSLQEMGGIL